jgi:DNA-binding NarL/FixJ family response regulator
MKKNEKLRILIADDHYLIRMGLNALVGTEPDMEVVAEAADGQQALEMFAKHQPDLVLMDLRMPGNGGIQAILEIRKKFPAARFLVLSAFDGDEDIYRALQAGAQGYVLKKTTGDKLVPALRAVAAGQTWIPKEVASQLASRKLLEELTTRELQVLEKLAHGLANKEIADLLNISEHTVKDHLKSILGKLRVADRTEAVTTAIQRGIIHLEHKQKRETLAPEDVLG